MAAGEVIPVSAYSGHTGVGIYRPARSRRIPATPGAPGLTFRRSLNACARNFPASVGSGLAGCFQVDEALGLLFPGSHEPLDAALVVDGQLQ